MLLAELKVALKQRIAEGANYAIRQLEEVLRPDSDKFNEFVQIKGRYNAYLNAIVSGMASKAELDSQYNQISTALLYFTDSLHDEYLRTEPPAPGPAQAKRGELLYHIPHEMQTAHEYKCAVRVAYLRALLYEDWQQHDDDVQKSIPVAEIMSVELLNQDSSEPFEIRSFSDTIQFLDQDFHTEWAFYVKPRRIGAFPLLLKISVVETRNGRDVQRNIVLEERVVVTTDAPLEVETKFQKSDIRLELSGKSRREKSKRQGMRTKTEAQRKAERIVSKWIAGAALTGWIPGSTIFLAGSDMIMIRQVADAFGVKSFDEAAIKSHLGAVVAASIDGVLAGEALNFIPLVGQILKAGVMAGKAKLIGKAVIDYFEDMSLLSNVRIVVEPTQKQKGHAFAG